MQRVHTGKSRINTLNHHTAVMLAR